MGGGLIGNQMRPDLTADELRKDFRSVAEQADRHRPTLRARFDDETQRVVEVARLPIEVARPEPHLEPRGLALDRQQRCTRHRRRQRLRAAHPAQACGQDPLVRELAPVVLPSRLGKRFVRALDDALAADVDPRARGHLAVHHQALAIQFVEVVPVRPLRHEIRIRDQHARRIGVRPEYADRLAGLDQQAFVGFERTQRFDDALVAFPIARGLADAAVDHELLGALGDLGIEVVHQHPQRRLGEPALCRERRSARRTDSA